ncbi:extracellular solute-binding protein, partial [Candidatus Bipolaricaulota bacterium]|nr:extracellular solute-binding protein [Candidatus Bipolaricaulota bacterium]
MRRWWILAVLGVSLLGLQVWAADPIKLTFQTLFHEADAQAMEQIINMFNETHDGIKVELIQGGWTQYYAQFRLSVISGNPPQLGVCHTNKLVEMADYLTPLDASPVGNLLEIAGIDPDSYVGANWAAGELGGHHYLI